MYQGFHYISNNGILKTEDYRPFSSNVGKCNTTVDQLQQKGHMKDIGFVEFDRRTNAQLKEILQKNTVSMSMFTTGMMGAYKSGIFTEEFVRCSYPENEVNHGVVMVGYGKVTPRDKIHGRC